MYCVARNCEAGTRNILLAQVGQRLLKFLAPLGIAARNPLPSRAGLPDTQEPDPVEAHLGQAIQLGVGNIVQGRRSTKVPKQLGQPHASVDLIQQWIGRQRHDDSSFAQCNSTMSMRNLRMIAPYPRHPITASAN